MGCVCGGGGGHSSSRCLVGKCLVKPSCLEGDNHTNEICLCRIEQFDRFINYRYFGIRPLCRYSEVYDATDRMSYPGTHM